MLEAGASPPSSDLDWFCWFVTLLMVMLSSAVRDSRKSRQYVCFESGARMGVMVVRAPATGPAGDNWRVTVKRRKSFESWYEPNSETHSSDRIIG